MPTILLILAAASQTATLVAYEVDGPAKYCLYERDEVVWELELYVDDICPATITTDEQDDA